MDAIGKAPASAQPKMNLTAASPAKLCTEALQSIKTAQAMVNPARSFATGSRWIIMAVGHSKTRNPK